MIECPTSIAFVLNTQNLTSEFGGDTNSIRIVFLIINFRYEFFTSAYVNSPAGRGYFCVVPEWHLSNQQKLTLNSLSIVTHLTKQLGPLSEWEDRLMVAREAGWYQTKFKKLFFAKNFD